MLGWDLQVARLILCHDQMGVDQMGGYHILYGLLP